MEKQAVWGLWLAFGLVPFSAREGATEPAAANHADARALAAADFGEDGTPDLICGFAVGEKRYGHFAAGLCEGDLSELGEGWSDWIVSRGEEKFRHARQGRFPWGGRF